MELDPRLSDQFAPCTFGAGPDGAREVLSADTTSMITSTGLVFSITIVVLQLTSSQFSPRVLRTFLRDRQTQFSLGILVATFVYAVFVLRTVNGQGEDDFVPAVATSFGPLLLLVSVGAFVAYTHHVATMNQVSLTLHSIAVETREVLDRELPTGLPPSPLVVRPRDVPLAVLPAPRSGVLTGVDTDQLVRLACEADVVLVTLARALSPGVNDPTAAVGALDGMHDLLRLMATRSLPSGAYADAEGRVRLHLPRPLLAACLALALDEAEQCGADSTQVQQRLRGLLDDLCTAALPEHSAALEARVAERRRP